MNKEDNYDEGLKGSTEAYQIASANNWEVVLPSPNQLQLDFDDDSSYQVFLRQRNIVEKFKKITQVVERTSKSGKPGKKHVTVDLESPVTPAERITLQALLGSDRMRETLSWANLQKGDANPTLFYESKSTK